MTLFRRLSALITCLFYGHVERFLRYPTANERRLWPGTIVLYRCTRCQGVIYSTKPPASAVRPPMAPRPAAVSNASAPGPQLIEATKHADALGMVLMKRDDLTAYCRLRDTASDFIGYYTGGGGCSNCGGLPHTTTCFVARFNRAAGWPEPVAGVPELPAEGAPDATCA